MFFALIRGRGGFTNNPTAIEYTNSYKKLLMNKTTVFVSSDANCTLQDSTILLTNRTTFTDLDSIEYGDSKKYYVLEKPSTKNPRNCEAKEKKETEKVPKIMLHNFEEYLGQSFKKYSSCEHDYFSKWNDHVWNASECCVEVVRYISGNVVRVLKSKIHCKSCLDLINSADNHHKAKSTRIKNGGGLIYASAEVEYICLTVERVIRQFNKCNSLSKSNIFERLIIET